jgi:hypothetical protein
VLPSEASPDYDPNATLAIHSDDEATMRLGPEMGYQAYSLMPTECLADQMVRVSQSPHEEVCFVEYALKYKKWSWGLGIGVIRRREFEYLAQILVAPIEREDLNALAVVGSTGITQTTRGFKWLHVHR